MDTKEKSKEQLHSLIPLDDFKALLGVDDREDKLSRFCLVTSTLTIERFCRRQLLRKTHFEYVDFCGDLVIPLKEYPVFKVEAAYSLFSIAPSEFIEPDFYQVIPECGTIEDMPFCLSFSPAVGRFPGPIAFKVVYLAGYSNRNIPQDLAAACLELAAWNMNRYKGRRIGMTGNVRKGGESFEMSMPSQVRQLLEPYRRKVI